MLSFACATTHRALAAVGRTALADGEKATHSCFRSCSTAEVPDTTMPTDADEDWPTTVTCFTLVFVCSNV